MDTALVVVPHAQHRERARRAQVDVNIVAPARRERRQPQVRVVAGAQRAVEEIGDDPNVVSVLGQHVDVGRIGAHLQLRAIELDRVAALVEELERTQPNVVRVSPSAHDVDLQVLPGRRADEHAVFARLNVRGRRRSHGGGTRWWSCGQRRRGHWQPLEPCVSR